MSGELLVAIWRIGQQAHPWHGAKALVQTPSSRKLQGALAHHLGLAQQAPNTSIRMKGFDYDANKQEGSMVIAVLRGALVFASGALTKSSPDAVKVTTPTTTAGIRGTEFVIEVQGGSDDD